MRDDSLLFPAITVLAGLIGLVLWPFIAIFIHELGHAIAGKLVGLSPSRFIIGYPDDEGDPLFSFRIFGCAVECWPLPLGGATFFSKLPSENLKMFIITIGGPLTDILVIIICVLLWHYTVVRIGLFFIILSQSSDILCNLIPRSFLYEGVRVASDSKVVLQLLAGKRQT